MSFLRILHIGLIYIIYCIYLIKSKSLDIWTSMYSKSISKWIGHITWKAQFHCNINQQILAPFGRSMTQSIYKYIWRVLWMETISLNIWAHIGKWCLFDGCSSDNTQCMSVIASVCDYSLKCGSWPGKLVTWTSFCHFYICIS